MPSNIRPLNHDVSGLICANIKIITPVSVVKELLDNAIDAKSSSIEILISPDTISKIEVRDDGLGVHLDDHDALGRPGHTSKLRKIEDLASIGGRSLGFRGEALGSINSVAKVTVTTKTATEPIAAALKLIPGRGGVDSHKSIPAPVGTTVCITNLFSGLPVREQAAIREAKKNLEKIQDLLRTYAMARPQIKLFLKVKQTPTKLWTYSPKRNANVNEAMLQLFGKDVASNHLEKVVHVNGATEGGSTPGPETPGSAIQSYVLESLFFDPKGDPKKSPKKHYFSVDGRPMNANRGVMKKLLAIYRESVRSCTGLADLGDCFIRLNISCPPATYDINIEPAKDEVLFTDEQLIVNAFRGMCSEAYKSSRRNQSLSGRSTSFGGSGTRAQASSNDQGHSHDSAGESALMIRSPKESTHNAHQGMMFAIGRSSDGGELPSPLAENNSSQVLHHDPPIIHSCIDIDGEMGKPRPVVGTQNRIEQRHGEVGQLLQHPKKAQLSRSGESKPTGSGTVQQHLNLWPLANSTKSTRQSLPQAGRDHQPHELGLQSPSTPEPPVLRHTMAAPGDLDVPISQQQLTLSSPTDANNFIGRKVPGGPFRSPMPSQQSSGQMPDIFRKPTNRSSNSHQRRRREQPPWTPPSSAERVGHVNRMPPNPSSLQPSDGLKQSQISFNNRPPNSRHQRQIDDPSGMAHHNSPNINQHPARNGVNIQEMITKAKGDLQYQKSQENERPVLPYAGHRDFQTQPHLSVIQRKPLRTVENNSLTENQTIEDDIEPVATTLSMDDPRAYLLRRQKSVAAADQTNPKRRKLRRMRSCLLPLETIPPECLTGHLQLTINLTDQNLDVQMRQLAPYDEYMRQGELYNGLDMNLSEAREVESNLQKLLEVDKENIGEGVEINLSLQSSVKGKGVAVE